MIEREATLATLRSGTGVDVLILGGGINGVGLLRELAQQGVDALLVDKGDYASGASSKSSRMIHGGMRYLENREFALVTESLLERNRLLANAPHFVAPLRTTIPLFSRFGGLARSIAIFFGWKVRPGSRGAAVLKFGLWFYDWVTRANRRTPTHYFTGRDDSLRELPGLHPEIIGTATYWDAWITQAERLCIELVEQAQALHPGCRAANYVRAVGASADGVEFEDLTSGERFTVRPRLVVNATGAWVDLTNAALGLESRYMGGTKGSHLVVDCPELYRALGDRMVYYQHTDGRVCIVFTFLDKVILGSTDLRLDDPDAAVCDDDEVDYMLTTLRGVFPGIAIGREQVVFKFCGVRPLPSSEGTVLANVSRGHSLRRDEPTAARPFALYSLIGGKWTTFRAFAQQVADRLLADLGRSRAASTEHLAIGGGADYPAEPEAYIARLAADTGASEARARSLLSRYGTAAAQFAAEDATPLTTLPDYSVGEIRRLARAEQVVHLADLIVRRSLIALLGQASQAALAELATLVGDELGWDAARRAEEVAAAWEQVRVT